MFAGSKLLKSLPKAKKVEAKISAMQALASKLSSNIRNPTAVKLGQALVELCNALEERLELFDKIKNNPSKLVNSMGPEAIELLQNCTGPDDCTDIVVNIAPEFTKAWDVDNVARSLHPRVVQDHRA